MFLLPAAPNHQDGREISAEQLIYAVEEFEYSTEFLKDFVECPKQIRALSLNQVWDLRHTEEWELYLDALTDAKKRTRLNEVDYYNIPNVWKRHRDFVQEAAERCPNLEWEKQPGALSVIYRFENLTLKTVYRDGERNMLLPTEEEVARSGVRQRRLGFHIDYVCADVLQKGWATPLQTEIRLFEGTTLGKERKNVFGPAGTDEKTGKGRQRVISTQEINIYDELVKALKACKFQDVSSTGRA